MADEPPLHPPAAAAALIQFTPTVGFVARDHNNPQSVFGSRRRGVVSVLWVK